MEHNETSSILRHAAKKAGQMKFFLAEYLSEFRRFRGFSEEEVAQFLGCNAMFISKLSLCRRPQPQSQKFRSDVELIAVAFNIQPSRLVQLIREVEAMKVLCERKLVTQEVPQGLLAVARDITDVELDNDGTVKPVEDGEEEK
ncbi:MAG: hypothetical protein WC359_10705 [Dehalococcoidia bacterium]|jgi:transcriptional regulator with XRE-family HTH domain